MLRSLLFSLLLCSVASAQMGANLVPPSSATDTAKQTGRWQDASTWTDETVPTLADRVLIPVGLTVTNHATAEALWIHAAGTLACCDHCDTQFNVHTIYVPMGGALRLHSTGKCVVEWLPGPFLAGDTTQLSRGLICHGMLMAEGVSKTAWGEVADQSVAVGVTSLTMAQAPQGWQVGDKLIVCGTDSRYYQTPDATYQTETVTLTGVNGNVITFSEPLKYRHFRWRADIPFHCGNLTRNVVFRSRDPNTLANRGHLMSMGGEVNDMRYVAIEGCGRTDVFSSVTDPRFDVYGEMVPGSDANVRARYADHWHRRGQLSRPGVRIGCVVNGFKKWGFLIHDSVAHLKDCIAVNGNGGAFATEEGQERGSFDHCLGAMVRGMGDTIRGSDDDHSRSLNGIPNGDFGIAGDGFWIHSGQVHVTNCVACDVSGRGFGMHLRTLNSYPNYPTTLPDYLRYPIAVQGTLLPLAYDGVSATPASTVPIQRFDNNAAYGCKLGFQGWSGPTYDTSSNKIWPDGVRGTITNLTLWGRGGKFHSEYQGRVNIDGLKIVGDRLFRSDGSISRWSEAALFRTPEVTVKNWDIAGTGGEMFRVVGVNDPGGIPAKNIVIQGATVQSNGTVTIP